MTLNYEQNNAYLQHHHGSPPNARCRCTNAYTKSAHACTALVVGCDLVYVTSGFKTPTIL